MPNASPELLQAIAVTAELCGNTTLSRPAAQAMAEELAAHPELAVLEALKRCRRELTGHLSLAAVLQRLDTGHPGPEEAWAMVSQAIGDERVTLVVTTPMREAFFAAAEIEGDHIAARMSFLEVYRRAVATAGPPDWDVILGHDATGRETALMKAVQLGQITPDRALGLLLASAADSRTQLLEMAEDALKITHNAGRSLVEQR